MYQIISNIALAILAYIAGKAKTNDSAKAAYYKIALQHEKQMREIDGMDEPAVDAELAKRVQPVKRNQSA